MKNKARHLNKFQDSVFIEYSYLLKNEQFSNACTNKTTA